MSSHDTGAHDTLMRDILTDSPDVEEAFASSQLADCPECVRTFAELQGKLAQLDAAGSEERAELAAIRGTSEAPAAHEERALDGLRNAMQAEFALGRPTTDERAGWARLARLAPGLVAAAAALWLAFVLFVPSDPTPTFDPDARLGTSQAPYDLSPTGTVDAWGPFTWGGTPPEEGYFVVRIYDTDWNPIAESNRLFENQWTPPTALALPAAIHWTVSAYAPLEPRAPRSEASADARLR